MCSYAFDLIKTHFTLESLALANLVLQYCIGWTVVNFFLFFYQPHDCFECYGKADLGSYSTFQPTTVRKSSVSEVQTRATFIQVCESEESDDDHFDNEELIYRLAGSHYSAQRLE